MKEYNLGWGNAVAVRSAFLEGLSYRAVGFALNDENLSYTPHEGDAKLIEITRKVLERQIGITYQHILLVNGASGGATIALRAYAQKGHKSVYTRKPPYFPVYPAMAEAAGMRIVRHDIFLAPIKIEDCYRPVILWDSPGNPSGEILEHFEQPTLMHIPVIWDAVYHSRVYVSGTMKPMYHDVVVGSYSKLLGLNGLRTGWIATNDPLLYERMKSLVVAEYCGLSSASNVVLLTVLKDYRSKYLWENFEYRARNNLNANREEISKLEKYFGYTRVPENGMFYYAPIDAACKRLLEKSGIVWTKGSYLGTNDDFGRFNVGQDCKLIRDAVKTVIKNDKIKK